MFAIILKITHATLGDAEAATPGVTFHRFIQTAK